MDDPSTLATVTPLGPRAISSPRLIATARSAWGLGPVTGTSDLGGSYNLNLRLQTSGDSVVLRVYRPWVSADRLSATQAIRVALRDLRLPVVAPLPTSSGEMTVMVAGRLAEVEPWLPDDGGTDDRERLLAAAGLLGRLHARLRVIQPAVPIVPAPVSNDLSPRVFDDWLARTARAVAAAPRTDRTREARWACRAARTVALAMRRIPRRSGNRQLIHGDYGHENVRFTGSVATAIVDFDFLHEGDRIIDLADLAFSFHWMGEFGQLDLPPADRDWDIVLDLIHRHDEFSDQPLTAEEIDALPLAMAAVPLHWIAASWLLEDPVAAVCLVAPELAAAAWLVEHHDELSARWASRQTHDPARPSP